MESFSPSASATTESRKKMRLADETAGELSADEMAIILSFLPCDDVLRLLQVCTTWRDAARKTLVPLTESEFQVDSVRKYKVMRVLSTALPNNLQQLSIWNLYKSGVFQRGRYQSGPKYSNGEGASKRWARHTANWTTLDIDIISRFSTLRSLTIWDAPLNGRYPALLNFPLLQKVTIGYCYYLKWDLEMLTGLPLLKEFNCDNNAHITGSLSNLRVLKDTLEKVKITCHHVEGNFIDLADFTRLKSLDLRDTNVRGDIRDIREHHFPALEKLFLPMGVHGGCGYKFQNVADVPEFMQTIRLLLQRTPDLFGEYGSLRKVFDWSLSEDSTDWYDWERGRRSPPLPFDLQFIQNPPPPFQLQFVQAGSRRGWSWCTWTWFGPRRFSCEINWLDPEPSSESGDYETYIAKLQDYQHETDFYRGYHEPPTEEEYRRLREGLLP